MSNHDVHLFFLASLMALFEQLAGSLSRESSPEQSDNDHDTEVSAGDGNGKDKHRSLANNLL